ncbi:MAG TPA: hypothetical protein VIL27_04035 [Clostridia bacterium]
MTIEKIHLANLDQCYAINRIQFNGARHILLATEGHGPCYAFVGPGLAKRTVWEGPGGTMSMIPIPKRNGEFLAVQNFFPTFQSENATLVWVVPQVEGSYEVHPFLQLPFLHRFDLIPSGGVTCFLGATLCSSKAYKDDWSDPGKIWGGTLPDNPASGMTIRPILEGMTKNHGYSRVSWQGRPVGCFTSEQGAFLVFPPEKPGEEWKTEQLLDFPVGDIAFCDLDNDGEYEIMTIEPFHGRRILIRKKILGRYEVIWEYDQPIGFGHVVWGGRIRGLPTFIAGYREEGAALFMVQAANAAGAKLQLKTTVIDLGTGPSNIAVQNDPDEDLILSANRTAGEGVLYRIRD